MLSGSVMLKFSGARVTVSPSETVSDTLFEDRRFADGNGDGLAERCDMVGFPRGKYSPIGDLGRHCELKATAIPGGRRRHGQGRVIDGAVLRDTNHPKVGVLEIKRSFGKRGTDRETRKLQNHCFGAVSVGLCGLD